MVDMELRQLMKDTYDLLEQNEQCGANRKAEDWYKLFNGMSALIAKHRERGEPKMKRYAEIMAVAVYRLLDCKYDGLSMKDDLTGLEENIGKRLDYCMKHGKGN